MDPITSGPDEHGQDSGHGPGRPGGPASPRPPRDPLAPDLGQQAPARARTVRLVTGDFLVTVNPVDGSEIEHCPPGEHPGAPERYSPQERADLLRAAGPPVPPGPAGPELPLLERQEEHEQLVRLLARGRSVRLTGPAGSGRTSLLDAVARDCSAFAPDGVVRLSGYHRTPADLLYGLFAAVHRAPLHRPDRAELLALVRRIGAIVVLDDLEFGGAALEELLDATPECAFLLAATPEVTAPLPESHLEEVVLGGLGRSASLDLLERAVERPLTDEEANWAGDLWFESEGLPLRFVQAGALLRQRDLLRTGPEAFGSYPGPSTDDAFPDGSATAGPPGDAPEVPLPTLGQGAAPAQLLAERLSDAARATLAFAVALGGEVPHQAHLPALVGDTHADAAMGELAGSGLLSPAGSHHRLAAGVVQQLEAGGYADDSAGHALTTAQHYAWWAGHPSVAPERAAAEADAILAAMSALVPGTEAGHPSAAVLLARSAAPAFAAGLHWSAWERALRTGQEAARLSGEVAQEAYFHHELGVLALCTGNADRALAELEASIALRGALADKAGTVAGRRALALIADRSGAASLGGYVPGGPGDTPAQGAEILPSAHEDAVPPPVGTGAAGAVVSLSPAPDDHITLVTQQVPGAGAAPHGRRRTVLGGARRNLVAAGAGVLLAGVLGTVVTLGATSDNDSGTGDGRPGRSVNDDTGKDGMSADEPTQSAPGTSDGSAGSGTGAPSSSGSPSATGSPRPSGSSTPSDGASTPGDASSSPSGKPSGSSGKPPTKPSTPPTKPSHSPPSSPSTSPSDPPGSPSPTPSGSASEDPPPANSPSSTQSVMRPSTASNGPVDSGSPSTPPQDARASSVSPSSPSSPSAD
ncbi:ATP-binding protein [Streptomyces sp. NPDC006649]|uniref:ATP-binding protein n=1 Tax=Streptomyces sp. NPDC006649 TaxID=3156896 RepID=UPI0033A8BA3C